MRRVMYVVAMACLACTLLVPVASAAETEEDPVLDVTFDSVIEVDCLGVTELAAVCSPSSVEVGIPCGMEEMCGQDPCLCGKTDAFGACACNGTEEVCPSYAVEFSEEGVATTLELFGRTYIFGASSGTVDMNVTTSLPHYQSVSETVRVEVHPFTGFDLLRLLATFVVFLLACGLIALIVWLIVHTVRKRRASSQTDMTYERGE